MIKQYLALLFLFIGFTVFEITIYINDRERITEFEYSIKAMQVEIEELRKAQRLISQDADYALRIVVESAGGTDAN